MSPEDRAAHEFLRDRVELLVKALVPSIIDGLRSGIENLLVEDGSTLREQEIRGEFAIQAEVDSETFYGLTIALRQLTLEAVAAFEQAGAKPTAWPEQKACDCAYCRTRRELEAGSITPEQAREIVDALQQRQEQVIN